jgi:hypothetical protein
VGADHRAAGAGRIRLTSATRGAAIAALAVLVLTASLACGGGSGDESVVSGLAVTPTTTALPGDLPSGDPSVTVVNVVQACREKDADRLRSFVAVPVPEADMEALFARGSDVRLESQTLPEVEDGQASVSVRLEVHRDGEVESVERDWALQLEADGIWRFAALPDCF